MSGIAVLDKIANGVTDVKSLAACIQTDRIKKKEFIQKSLRNCLTKEHCFLIQQLMLQYTNLMSQLGEIDSELEKHVEAHNDVLQRLDEIPGIDRISARGILAEASTNMEAFKSDRHFAAWAGVASGNNESAKKKKEVDVDMAIPS
jgi:transposase